jgi:hypothetical protein
MKKPAHCMGILREHPLAVSFTKENIVVLYYFYKQSTYLWKEILVCCLTNGMHVWGVR